MKLSMMIDALSSMKHIYGDIDVYVDYGNTFDKVRNISYGQPKSENSPPIIVIGFEEDRQEH